MATRFCLSFQMDSEIVVSFEHPIWSCVSDSWTAIMTAAFTVSRPFCFQNEPKSDETMISDADYYSESYVTAILEYDWRADPEDSTSMFGRLYDSLLST